MEAVGTMLFVVGGETADPGDPTNELWEYNTITRMWRLISGGFYLSPMPGGLSGEMPTKGDYETAVLGTDIYVLGPSDVWTFSTSKQQWKRMQGDFPLRRNNIAVAGGDLYFVGTNEAAGPVQAELIRVFKQKGPRNHEWPASLSSFTRIYDGDTIVVHNDAVWEWNFTAHLCSETYMPCSLAIVGGGTGKLHRRGAGAISCDADASAGSCTSVTLKNVAVACSTNLLANIGPLQVSGSGAVLSLEESNISDCRSVQDGGSVRARNGANVTMTGSAIRRSSSEASAVCPTFAVLLRVC